jgi:hypothetical protein
MPPGRYWIKAIWKLSPPFNGDVQLQADGGVTLVSNRSAVPAVADYYEMSGRKVFEILSGEVTTVRISYP